MILTEPPVEVPIMKRIAFSAFSLMLLASSVSVAQQSIPDSLRITPISMPETHTVYHGGWNKQPCPTCNATPAHVESECPTCRAERGRLLKSKRCDTCGTACESKTCDACSTKRLHRERGNLPVVQRLWKWLVWRPQPTNCDWHSEINPSHPDGYEYFKCQQGPGYSCGSCGPREKRDWNLGRLRHGKCPTCGSCSTCGSGTSSAPTVNPVMPVAPAVQPIPTPLPPQQLPPTTSMYPNRTIIQPITPQPQPSIQSQMLPGYRPTPIQNARYAPDNYPAPVPADYRLPPISLPLTRPLYQPTNTGYGPR